jgi:hypothetical protein
MTTIVALPEIDWYAVEFTPVQVRQTDRMEGRRTEDLIVPGTWWRASYQAEHLDRRAFGQLDAFVMTAGAGALFRAYDPERPRPMAQDNGQPLSGLRAGGGAFDGTATLQTIVSPTQIIVSGLPDGFQLWTGDYFELAMAPLLVSLHRVTADATANAGGTVTLNFRHALDLQHFTTAAIVNFEKPACLMRVDPGSYSAAKTNRDRRPAFSAQEMFPTVEEAP